MTPRDDVRYIVLAPSNIEDVNERDECSVEEEKVGEKVEEKVGERTGEHGESKTVRAIFTFIHRLPL